MIKLMIVDDEMLIREGLKLMLSSFEDIDVVTTQANGQDAFSYCKNHPVDVILMDIRMPICNGVLGTRLIKETYPQIKILILTTFKDTEFIQDALHFGASGYLLKDSSHEVIYESIKSAVMGNIIFHPEVASQILTSHQFSKKEQLSHLDFQLSEKEFAIVCEIANGLSNKEIAAKLFLSEGTIKNHITNILFKLNLRDRTQIAIFALKNHLV